MKKTNKKGFTLVELLVVIAILAILATVAVVGYTSFQDKAYESNDRTLVAQLNKTLIGGKFETAHDAFEAVRAAGFDVSRIEATAKNQEILWDMDNKEFFYSADETRTGDIWIVDTKVSDKYSTYYVGTANIVTDLTTKIVVYTNDPTLTLSIDAKNAHVEHEGMAGSINVIAVANNSYYENGLVNELNVTAGKIVVNGAVATLKVVGTANVNLSAGSETVKVIVNDATATVKADENAEVGNVATEVESVLESLGTIVDGADDVIVDVVVKADDLGDFAGGFGTEEFPYLIANAEQLRNISKHYDTYNYYKVADGVTSLDLTGVGRISLHGSFDGNGVSLVNLTTSLFEYVGYQLAEETIKISNITATMNATDGHAFVRNIYNAGTTTFENVTLHGYIEGLYNMGSFYNYGTANYDGVGADYTVEFINSKSDMTIVCTSGNIAGGFLGHAYEGAGNSFTLKIDANSAYTGKILTTNGKGNLYFTMTSDYNNALNKFIVNGEEVAFDNGHIPAAGNLGKIAVVAPVAGENGYTVTPVEGAATFVVYLNAQVTAYDEEGNKITNKAGMTWPLGNVEMAATDGKVFDLVTSSTIVNGTDHDLGYVLEDGALTIYSGRTTNYCEGNVRLQVNQYDANGNLLAVGTLELPGVVRPQ